jgi:hypothetical protein
MLVTAGSFHPLELLHGGDDRLLPNLPIPGYEVLDNPGAPSPKSACPSLQVIRGDVGCVLEQLGRVFREHGPEVGDVSGELTGEGIGHLLEILEDFLQASFEDFSIISGH